MAIFVPRDYPTMEIAIALWSVLPERVQEGDIVAVRPPGSAIGFKEDKVFLWLLVEGLEANLFEFLTMPVIEPFDATGHYDGPTYTEFDKRRYCVPMARLKEVYPALDLDKARDPADRYQPFFTLDTDSNFWLTDQPPLTGEGLVFDKVTGVYL